MRTRPGVPRRCGAIHLADGTILTVDAEEEPGRLYEVRVVVSRLTCVAAVGVVAAGAFAATRVNASRTHSLCGSERWTVKTLQDRPSLLPVRTVTLPFLVTRPAPASLPYTRLPFERHVYRVLAAVTEIRPEDDGDYHLILRDHGRTMIAETPMLSCTGRATPLMRARMQAARRVARVCPRAAVTGVAFFDYDHGQTGVAPNAIEPHPVLRFQCLSP